MNNIVIYLLNQAIFGYKLKIMIRKSKIMIRKLKYRQKIKSQLNDLTKKFSSGISFSGA
jgi:hypothetical protein